MDFLRAGIIILLFLLMAAMVSSDVFAENQSFEDVLFEIWVARLYGEFSVGHFIFSDPGTPTVRLNIRYDQWVEGLPDWQKRAVKRMVCYKSSGRLISPPVAYEILVLVITNGGAIAREVLNGEVQHCSMKEKQPIEEIKF